MENNLKRTRNDLNVNGGEVIDDYLCGGMIGSPSHPRTVNGAAPAVGANYILHTVSKFDTLAGVAIKYGVEVADIKRLNGLVTDLQMFALKTLQIPLPGRHPPSTSLCNGHITSQRPSTSEGTPSSRRHSDLFESFLSMKLNSSSWEKKVSPAMSSLQGYYGLREAANQKQPPTEGFEMAVFQRGGPHYLEDGPFTTSLPISNPPLNHHRKSRSIANGLASENGGLLDPLLSQEAANEKSIEKPLRRRQKSEADFNSRTPEKLLKEEISVSGGSAISSAITGKGLALRPKSASRTVSGGVVDSSEAGGPNSIPVNSNDSFVAADVLNGVRKSSSTSSLQDSENNNGAFSSIWPTSRWSLKPDFQALSAATMTRPIFDGLPKPMGRRNKTALD